MDRVSRRMKRHCSVKMRGSQELHCMQIRVCVPARGRGVSLERMMKC